MKTYTVIGVWIGDEPVTAGVIEGQHYVSEGNDVDRIDNSNGPWGTVVEAPDSQSAETYAEQEMREAADQDARYDPDDDPFDPEEG